MQKFWNGLAPNTKWAIVIFGALILWFVSGIVFKGGDTPPETGTVKDSVARVAVRDVAAVRFVPVLSLSARTEAVNKARVSAQTSGRIARMAVVRGDTVSKGQTLVVLDPAARPSNVRSAAADVAKALGLAEAGRELAKDGYVAATTLAAREAELLAARERLALAKQDLAYATIVSPLDGVVEDTPVVVGDF
ncbi:MAG: hypothetical protein COY40_04215, partial [Alphaproteobacteria bacterium CG_4_10_14_0_8_um_filter_53_9]